MMCSCALGMRQARMRTIDGMAATDWVESMIADLSGRDNVRMLPRTAVWGYYDDNALAALERVADHKAHAAIGEPRHFH